jgi:hypothetical protein
VRQQGRGLFLVFETETQGLLGGGQRSAFSECAASNGGGLLKDLDARSASAAEGVPTKAAV